jgi:hypothetical protein
MPHFNFWISWSVFTKFGLIEAASVLYLLIPSDSGGDEEEEGGGCGDDDDLCLDL